MKAEKHRTAQKVQKSYKRIKRHISLYLELDDLLSPCHACLSVLMGVTLVPTLMMLAVDMGLGHDACSLQQPHFYNAAKSREM